MKYGQFYYSYGVYGTEGSPNMYLASSSSSATTMFLRKVVPIWTPTPSNPATWQDASLNPAVWTDQTTSDADWQDTRT